MHDFQGRVAVVTGAADGIGRALARRCTAEGMRVVLADNDVAKLAAVTDELSASGADVLGVPTDVSRVDMVRALAEATYAAFGSVHLLCNNAGVGISTPILESTIEDWEWALGVNLWGIIHGVLSFVPAMRAGTEPCHIVNTASIAGLISPPGLGVYRTTKHAVVGFSEALYHELQEVAPHIHVSVLCPGLVRTSILSSAHRPANEADAYTRPNAEEERLRVAMDEGMDPDAVADLVFSAIRDERFYILTHPERNHQIRTRMDDILRGRNPSGSVSS